MERITGRCSECGPKFEHSRKDFRVLIPKDIPFSDVERLIQPFYFPPQKINAIALLRKTYGMGLKDAKDIVESTWAESI